MGVAQHERARVVQVLVFGCVYYGDILVHVLSHDHMFPVSEGVSLLSRAQVAVLAWLLEACHRNLLSMADTPLGYGGSCLRKGSMPTSESQGPYSCLRNHPQRSKMPPRKAAPLISIVLQMNS